MNPTRFNTTTPPTTTTCSKLIKNDYRYVLPLAPMPQSSMGAGVVVPKIPPSGNNITTSTIIQPTTTITTASGPALLHMIPMQAVNSLTNNNNTNLMPQMAIITTSGQLGTGPGAGQTHSILANQLQQPLQVHHPCTAGPSINVLLRDGNMDFVGNIEGVVGNMVEGVVAVNGSNLNNVSSSSPGPVAVVQTAAPSHATLIIPTTTSTASTYAAPITPVPVFNQELVKKIIVGGTTPQSINQSASLIRTSLPREQKPQQQKGQQQQLQKTQQEQLQKTQQQHQQKPQQQQQLQKPKQPGVKKQQQCANRLPVAAAQPKPKILNPTMMTGDNNNANKSTFAMPSGTVSFNNQSASTAKITKTGNSNEVSKNHSTINETNPSLLVRKNIKKEAISSTPVTQISNSVTLTIAQKKAENKLKPPEFASVTLEKSTVKQNHKGGQKIVKKEKKMMLTEPQRVAKKQESLLKSTPVQRIIRECISPRTKRSKSLNSVVNKDEEEQVAAERRFSTASEGKIQNHKSPTETTYILIEDDEDEMDEAIDGDNNAFDAEFLVDCLELKTSDNKSEIKLEIIKKDGVDEAREAVDQDNSLPEENKNKEKPKSVLEEFKSGENITTAPLETEHDEEQSIVESVSEDPLKIKDETIDLDYDELEQQALKPSSDVDEKPIEPLDSSLFCDEQILITSSSTSGSSPSINNSTNEVVVPVTGSSQHRSPVTSKKPLATNSSKALPVPASYTESPEINSYSTVLGMLSSFNMLSWKERIGSARGTNLRFQLNEFNLLQVHERCQPRYRIHTAYEKPIYERESYSIENTDPLLYLCRRCNCHGPAGDFLAPEFCSLECLKRDSRKRQRDVVGMLRKRPRKDTIPSPSEPPTAQQQQQQNTSSLLVKKFFRWSTYLTGKNGETAAPVDLFLNPFPTGPNNFQIGMKLEAIDPENCSLFCVCTVVDIQGYRLNLGFDGYDRMYNFWVNADSMDIFPPGWCAKTNRILQPPKGMEAAKFNWPAYLAKEKAIPAPRQLFTHLNSSSLPPRNPFRIGMHLEAEDLNDTGKLCVATVADVLDDRVRIHFDGWDDCYDYWVDINSPYIHPCGWHEGRQQLIVPPDFENSAFSWPDYICEHQSGAIASPEIFNTRDPIDFKPKMKLEVVDPRNPSLIRPATVIARKGHRVKLHLDMWPIEYCFWLEDDSPDLHPIGWCDGTGHDLEPPPGFQTRAAIMPCSIVGCRGIGNAKRFNLNMHSTKDSCPYAPENWTNKIDKSPRLENSEIEKKISGKTKLEQTAGTNKRDIHMRNELMKSRRSEPKATHSKSTFAEEIMERLRLLDNIKTRRSLQEKLQTTQVGSLEKLLDIKPELITPNDEEIPTTKSESSECSPSNDAYSETTCLKIAKEYLCDYGPRLQQNFNIWQTNLNFDFEAIRKNPLHWTTIESCLFVESLLNCPKTAQLFAHEDIDGAALLAMQQSDLTDILELKLGPAVKLFSHILQLRTWTITKFKKEENV